MRLLYIAAKKIIGGYGRLYNWFCTQPQARVEYGYLYNWYAATDTRNIASTGWHVPISTDFTTLISYVGANPGYAVTSTDLTYWSNVTGCTNNSGFNARGAGGRSYLNGVFSSLREGCAFWTSSVYYEGFGWYFGLYSTDHSIFYSSNAGYVKNGASIRLIKDSTTLTNGQIGSYAGNDGKVYKTICIGTQEWVSSDLMETKYRDGSIIPEVTDNTAWAALTTGARCSYNNTESNAGTTVSIAPAGWHVPSAVEWQTLSYYLGGNSIAGGKLKETGTTHWLSPNTGATNESGFSAIGSGFRDSVEGGVFMSLNEQFTALSSDNVTYSFISLDFDSEVFTITVGYPEYGCSLRLIKDDSTWTVGDTMTDIDGNVYPTVKIGTQVWTAKNLKVTKLNDGTPIPNVTDNAEWAALTTIGQCVYDNDLNNL
jgi:uncharacterized protein (TIGR02145 family)